MAYKLLVLCGPSGSGKSSIIKRLLRLHSKTFGFSVSHTTRKPRKGESNGIQYYFTDIPTIRKLIDRGDFIEYCSYSGNLYGTSKCAVFDVLNEGKICVLDIETQGVKQVKKTNFKSLYVFVRPPSLVDLKSRLKIRKSESKQSLALRMEKAELEIEFGMTPGNFDRVIVNDDLNRAYHELEEFVFNKIRISRKCSECGIE